MNATSPSLHPFLLPHRDQPRHRDHRDAGDGEQVGDFDEEDEAAQDAEGEIAVIES